MFGYPIKKSTASACLTLSRNIARNVLLLFTCSCLFATSGFANDKQRFDKKSPQEKQQIEKSRKQFKSLPPAQREKVKDRYEWYKDLPPEKQKEIRERWKKSGK